MTTMPIPYQGLVPRYRFAPEDKILLDGIPYRAIESNGETYLLLRTDRDDAVGERFSHDQIHSYVAAGRLARETGKASTKIDNIDLSDLPELKQSKVHFRMHMCRGFLHREANGSATRSTQSMREAIRELHQDYIETESRRQTVDARCGTSLNNIQNPPSPTTLRRWLRDFQAVGTAGLVDRYTRSGNRRGRLDPEVAHLLAQAARRYADHSRPSINKIHNDILNPKIEALNEKRRKAGLPPFRCPSAGALRHAIRNLDQIHLDAARYGRDAARKKYFPVFQGLKTTRALERVEIDECLLPLHVIPVDAGMWDHLTEEERKKLERKRLWLSLAIDAHTRCILAAIILESTPTTADALATLRMVMEDKSGLASAAGCRERWDMCGLPESVVTDNGSAYISDHFSTTAIDLCIAVITAPAGLPQARGRNERIFSTLNTGFFSSFTGRTFENTTALGDYKAQANASLFRHELANLLVRFIVDEYHNQPQIALGNRSPRQAWQEAVQDHGILPPPPPDRLRHIFGERFHRNITNRGVCVHNSYYQSHELQELRRSDLQKQVEISVDPQDLSAISVRNDQGDWFRVPSTTHEHPITLQEYQEKLTIDRARGGEVLEDNRETVNASRVDREKVARAAERRAGIRQHILTPEQAEEIDRDFTRDVRYHAPTGQEASEEPLLPIPEPATPESDAATGVHQQHTENSTASAPGPDAEEGPESASSRYWEIL